MENEANQRTACYLGLNPYAPETWPVETVNRLSRIHAEQGKEAFLREVSSLMTTPTDIRSPQNACCYRDKCLKAAAALTAAEARIKMLSEALKLCAERDPGVYVHPVVRGALTHGASDAG